MPIYEYQCGTCGHQLEAMQKFSDAPLTQCPECGKDTLKKLVSSTSFQLKGTGWYATDIRDKGKPKSTDTPKETPKTESDSAGSSSTTKTDSSSSSSSSNSTAG